MSDTLAADINRTGLHSLEVPDSFETDDSFVVELRNHGESTHVHLHLDDALSEVASLEAGNHYVGAESTRPVRVSLEGDGHVRGKLKIVTGYGKQTRYVDVVVEPDTSGPVEVAPDLSEPQRESRDEGSSLGAEGLPVLALGAVAVILAVGAVLASDGINVVLAVLAVVAAVVGAVYLLVQ